MEYSKSDEFITKESWRYNISILIKILMKAY